MNIEIIKAAFNMSARMVKCAECKHFDINKAKIMEDGYYTLCGGRCSFGPHYSIDIQCSLFEPKE